MFSVQNVLTIFVHQEVSLPEVTWGKRKVRLTLELESIITITWCFSLLQFKLILEWLAVPEFLSLTVTYPGCHRFCIARLVTSENCDCVLFVKYAILSWTEHVLWSKVWPHDWVNSWSMYVIWLNNRCNHVPNRTTRKYTRKSHKLMTRLQNMTAD